MLPLLPWMAAVPWGWEVFLFVLYLRRGAALVRAASLDFADVVQRRQVVEPLLQAPSLLFTLAANFAANQAKAA